MCKILSGNNVQQNCLWDEIWIIILLYFQDSGPDSFIPCVTYRIMWRLYPTHRIIFYAQQRQIECYIQQIASEAMELWPGCCGLLPLCVCLSMRLALVFSLSADNPMSFLPLPFLAVSQTALSIEQRGTALVSLSLSTVRSRPDLISANRLFTSQSVSAFRQRACVFVCLHLWFSA